MKLGKKKASGSEKPQPDAKVKKQQRGETKSKGNGTKLKSLAGVATQQAVVVLLAGLAAAALLYYLVLMPAQAQREAARVALVADSAKARLEQRLTLIRDVVEGYSRQTHVRDAIEEPTSRAQLVTELEAMLPGTRAVFVFPYGQVGRQSGRNFELSFVNLDLAKKAESGRQLHPDAFPGTMPGSYSLPRP